MCLVFPTYHAKSLAEFARRSWLLFRFQDDPRALLHLKVIVWVDENRLLECGFANLIMENPGEEFVAAVGPNDLVAQVFMGLSATVSETGLLLKPAVVLDCARPAWPIR